MTPKSLLGHSRQANFKFRPPIRQPTEASDVVSLISPIFCGEYVLAPSRGLGGKSVLNYNICRRLHYLNVFIAKCFDFFSVYTHFSWQF